MAVGRRYVIWLVVGLVPCVVLYTYCSTSRAPVHWKLDVNGVHSDGIQKGQSVSGIHSDVIQNGQSVNGIHSDGIHKDKSVNGSHNDGIQKDQSVSGIHSDIIQNDQSVNGIHGEEIQKDQNLIHSDGIQKDQSVSGIHSDVIQNDQSVNWIYSDGIQKNQSVNRIHNDGIRKDQSVNVSAREVNSVDKRDVSRRQTGYRVSRLTRPHRFKPRTEVMGNTTGYFDFPNMVPIRFSPNFKNPCWNGTKNNGPLHDNKIHCLPYFYIVGRRDPRQLSFFVNMYTNATAGILQNPASNKSGVKYYTHVTADASPSNIYLNPRWWLMPGNENRTEPRYTNLHCIHKLNPDAKIIVLFRDPVTRLYSDYLFRYRYGGRPSKHMFHSMVVRATAAFNKCLNTRPLRTCVYSYPNYANGIKFQLDLGLFAFYMREVLSVFKRENVLTVLLPEYKEDMKNVLQKVIAFLGLRSLSPTEMDKLLELKIQNDKSYIRGRTGPMLQETETILRDFYQPYNEEMSELMRDSRYLFSEK